MFSSSPPPNSYQSLFLSHFPRSLLSSHRTFRDISVAAAQGTLVDRPLAGYRSQSSYSRIRSIVSSLGLYVFLIASLVMCTFGIRRLRRVRKDHNFAPNWDPKQPLVFA
jgi:beta-lactamase regulating signal transducer with metallopeptidase domain